MKKINPFLNDMIIILTEEFERVGDNKSNWRVHSTASSRARVRIIDSFVKLPKAEVKRIISNKIWNHVPTTSYYYNSLSVTNLRSMATDKTKHARKHVMGFIANGIAGSVRVGHPKLNKFIGKYGVGVWQYVYLQNAYPDQRFPKTSANTKKFNNLMRNCKDQRVVRIAINNSSIQKVKAYYDDIQAGKETCARSAMWRITERVRSESRVNDEYTLIQNIVACNYLPGKVSDQWMLKREIMHMIPTITSNKTKKYLTEFLINAKETFEEENYLELMKGNNWQWTIYKTFITECLTNLKKDDLLFFIDVFPTDIAGLLTKRMESKWG